MKLSKRQKLAEMMDGRLKDNQYIVNKKEEGQPRFFKCVCCDKKIDLKDSDDYIGAVNQWKNFGEKCYMCGKGFCECKKGEKMSGKIIRLCLRDGTLEVSKKTGKDSYDVLHVGVMNEVCSKRLEKLLGGKIKEFVIK